jgi:hypothetical protein
VRLLFGADVMQMRFLAWRMFDYCLLTEILVQTRSRQFLLRRWFLLYFVWWVFEGIYVFGEGLMHIHLYE